MLYFAYGSNLDWNQMRERCPSAEPFCVAKLKGYRLAFTRWSCSRGCGVADAVPAKGKEIWGLVYRILKADVTRLDRYEGYLPCRKREDNAYVREECYVCPDGKDNEVLATQTYFVAQPEGDYRPSADYKKTIVTGACYWHLPATYVKELDEIPVQT